MWMRRIMMLTMAAGLLSPGFGCVSVKAPERINVGSGSEPVDSRDIPRTSSHDEARYELRRAYGRIRDLEGENARLRRKADEYKHERDALEDRLEKYEDD